MLKKEVDQINVPLIVVEVKIFCFIVYDEVHLCTANSLFALPYAYLLCSTLIQYYCYILLLSSTIISDNVFHVVNRKMVNENKKVRVAKITDENKTVIWIILGLNMFYRKIFKSH